MSDGYGEIRWTGGRVIRRDAAQGSEVGDVVDADRRSIRVVMSTDHPVGGPDREDGDVIPQAEWDLSRWMGSGAPILEGHRMGPGMCGGEQADVVANGSEVERDQVVIDGRTLDRTLTTITWSRTVPRAAILAEQYATGERSDVSVGFVPRGTVKRTALVEGDPYRVDPEWSRETGRPGGRLLRRPLLIELSAVTVGADQYATAVRALGGGLDASGLLTWGERRTAFIRAALEGLGDERQRAEAAAVLRELAADPAGWALVDEIHRAARAQHDPLIRALAALRG